MLSHGDVHEVGLHLWFLFVRSRSRSVLRKKVCILRFCERYTSSVLESMWENGNLKRTVSRGFRAVASREL